MKIDKKTIVFVLVSIAAVFGIVYFIRKQKNGAAAIEDADGADSRGNLAADDDATYNKMWALIPVADRVWVGDLVKDSYNSGTLAGADGGTPDLINGVVTKSAALQRVFFTSAPNDKGKYTISNGDGTSFKSLWPKSTYDAMYKLWIDFKGRYVKL